MDQIPILARAQASKLTFWFRRHYNLSPLDPRYLDMTEEGIVVEYEAMLCSEGEELKTCPYCNKQTYRKNCPYCKRGVVALTGDPLVDDLFARIEAGEDVDLDLLRSNQPDTFEIITPGSEP